jgi:type IV pilus assembly protein PilC
MMLEKIVKPSDASLITSQLALITSNGKTLGESIDALAKKKENRRYKTVLMDISGKLQKKISPAIAFATSPNLFDEFYCRLLKSAEAEGNYSYVLFKLSRIYERQSYLSNKIRSVFLFPSIFSAISISTLLLFFMVAVSHFYGNQPTVSGNLEIFKSVIFRFSSWLHINITLVLIALSLFYSLIIFINIRTNWVKKASGVFTRNLPFTGNIGRKILISMILERYMALFSCKTEPSEAMNISIRSTGNASLISNQLLTAKQTDSKNKSVYNLLKIRLLPSFLIQLISNTKDSRETVELLEKICQFYNEEVDAAIDAFNAVVSPAIILIPGLVVLSVLAVLYAS